MVDARYDLFCERCEEYICNPGGVEKVSFSVHVSEEEMQLEEELMQPDKRKNDDIYIKRDPRFLEYSAIQRILANNLLFYNAFVLHGSVISADGVGVMFSGKSGIGKSTRTRIWMREFPKSIIINGDKPFIRCMNDDIYAFGSPWCGKEGWNSNGKVPLKNILIVERAEADSENAITRLNRSEALSFLLKESYIPNGKNNIQIALKLFKQIIENVNFYSFHSAPTPAAIHLAYNTIFGA